MSVVEALEELRSSTDFLDHLADLNQAAEDERRRREQFTEDIDEKTKAEFINGEVVIHSPARLAHLNVSFFVVNLLGNFVMRRGLGMIAVEKCFIRCTRNDYEPDICFFTQARCAEWEASMKIFPPPDLVVEILSPSTERNDRTIKLHDYARHGIGEYWIVDADARTVEQYTLPSKGGYEARALLVRNDLLVSVAIQGFAAPATAFFNAQENQRAFRDLLG